MSTCPSNAAGRGTAAFAPLSERVIRFHETSREARPQSSPRWENMTKAFFEVYADMPFWERYARSMAYSLEQEPVYLLDEELLVGIVYQTVPGTWSPFGGNGEI